METCQNVVPKFLQKIGLQHPEEYIYDPEINEMIMIILTQTRKNRTNLVCPSANRIRV